MRDPGNDELARRRAARQADGTEEELPRLTWTDTLAMIIAAYQVLMPIVLVMIAALLAVYFLFRWLFL
jgi:hypothetical protein